MEADAVGDGVRKAYGEIAIGRTRSGCCGPDSSCGCSTQTSRAVGYSEGERSSAREAVAPACCESTLYNVCCEPDAKADCCGVQTAPGACGCNNTMR